MAVKIVGEIVPGCVPFHIESDRVEELTKTVIREALRLPESDQ